MIFFIIIIIIIIILVVEDLEEPNININGPLSARQRNAI